MWFASWGLSHTWSIYLFEVKFKIKWIFPSLTVCTESLEAPAVSTGVVREYTINTIWWLTDSGLHFCEAWIALCPLPAVGMLGNCRPCSSDLCRWWQECVLTRAKLWLWHLHAGKERPVLPIREQPNEPVDPVQLRDVTWYPSRLNLASVTLTLKQESTLLFAPDLAANLQVKVA